MTLSYTQRMILMGIAIGVITGVVIGGLGALLGVPMGVRGGLTGATVVVLLQYMRKKARQGSTSEAMEG